MWFKATVIGPEGMHSRTFHRFTEAASWLDNENNTSNHDTVVEVFNDDGTTEDSFFYSTKER